MEVYLCGGAEMNVIRTIWYDLWTATPPEKRTDEYAKKLRELETYITGKPISATDRLDALEEQVEKIKRAFKNNTYFRGPGLE